RERDALVAAARAQIDGDRARGRRAQSLLLEKGALALGARVEVAEHPRVAVGEQPLVVIGHINHQDDIRRWARGAKRVVPRRRLNQNDRPQWTSPSSPSSSSAPVPAASVPPSPSGSSTWPPPTGSSPSTSST